MSGGLAESWRERRASKQAARWMIRMHGPDAFHWRAAFEAWRERDPRNARAYERQQAIWSYAPGVRQSVSAPARPGWTLQALPLAAGLAGVLLVGSGIWWIMRDASDLVIAAEPDRTRIERLADGTRVVLARGSAIAVDFQSDARRLTVKRGRVRLDILPAAGRPAFVRAGQAELRTSEAKVDVALKDEGAKIILLAGRVQLASYDDDQRQPERTTLAPGEAVDVGTGKPPERPHRASPAELAWPSAMISFDGAPLGEVLAQANAVSFTPIRAGDAAIAALRVTGAYRIGDPAGLARSLAASLGLTVERLPDGPLQLVRAAH